MIKSMTLQQRVDRSLDAAVFENEYVDLMEREPEDVADDMVRYDSDLEREDPDAVKACVQDYQEWYRKEKSVEHPDKRYDAIVPRASIVRKACETLIASLTKEEMIELGEALDGGAGDDLLSLVNAHLQIVAPEVFASLDELKGVVDRGMSNLPCVELTVEDLMGYPCPADDGESQASVEPLDKKKGPTS